MCQPPQQLAPSAQRSAALPAACHWQRWYRAVQWYPISSKNYSGWGRLRPLSHLLVQCLSSSQQKRAVILSVVRPAFGPNGVEESALVRQRLSDSPHWPPRISASAALHGCSRASYQPSHTPASRSLRHSICQMQKDWIGRARNSTESANKKRGVPRHHENMRPGNSFPQICVVSEDIFIKLQTWYKST